MNKQLLALIVCTLFIIPILTVVGTPTVLKISHEEVTYNPIPIQTPLAPSTPIVLGPHVGGPELNLTFMAISEDPSGNEIYFQFDWGDGQQSDWIGPYNSSQTATTEHLWEWEGTYEITAKAKDNHNNESDWSDPFEITIEPLIRFGNIRPGYILFNLQLLNNSHVFLKPLQDFGISALITNKVGEGLYITVQAEEEVNAVKIDAFNPIWGYYFVKIDNKKFDGFSVTFDRMETALYEITVYAYDEFGNLIDISKIDYFAFIQVGGG